MARPSSDGLGGSPPSPNDGGVMCEGSMEGGVVGDGGAPPADPICPVAEDEVASFPTTTEEEAKAQQEERKEYEIIFQSANVKTLHTGK